VFVLTLIPPEQSGTLHSVGIPLKPATDSDSIRPAIPIEGGQ